MRGARLRRLKISEKSLPNFCLAVNLCFILTTAFFIGMTLFFIFSILLVLSELLPVPSTFPAALGSVCPNFLRLMMRHRLLTRIRRQLELTKTGTDAVTRLPVSKKVDTHEADELIPVKMNRFTGGLNCRLFTFFSRLAQASVVQSVQSSCKSILFDPSDNVVACVALPSWDKHLILSTSDGALATDSQAKSR